MGLWLEMTGSVVMTMVSIEGEEIMHTRLGVLEVVGLEVREVIEVIRLDEDEVKVVTRLNLMIVPSIPRLTPSFLLYRLQPRSAEKGKMKVEVIIKTTVLCLMVLRNIHLFLHQVWIEEPGLNRWR